MKRLECPVCKCKESESISVKNWIFRNTGLKSEYIYKKCADCGCLYREDMDIDYSLIYDDNYGGKSQSEKIFKRSSFRNLLKDMRNSYSYMNRHKILGRFLNYLRPANHDNVMKFYRKYLENGAKFLDMGCHHGSMIKDIKDYGADVMGAEPYIDDDIVYPNGATVRKKFLRELVEDGEKFDIIFYNNVFEHLDYPYEDLKDVYNALNDGGMCGLVFPACGSLMDEYGADTYTIQAPQHSIMHTEKSVKILAESAICNGGGGMK